eukprot:Opistho-1_new@64813
MVRRHRTLDHVGMGDQPVGQRHRALARRSRLDKAQMLHLAGDDQLRTLIDAAAHQRVAKGAQTERAKTAQIVHFGSPCILDSSFRRSCAEVRSRPSSSPSAAAASGAVISRPPSPDAHTASEMARDTSPNSPASAATVTIMPSASSSPWGSGTNTPPRRWHNQ